MQSRANFAATIPELRFYQCLPSKIMMNYNRLEEESLNFQPCSKPDVWRTAKVKKSLLDQFYFCALECHSAVSVPEQLREILITLKSNPEDAFGPWNFSINYLDNLIWQRFYFEQVPIEFQSRPVFMQILIAAIQHAELKKFEEEIRINYFFALHQMLSFFCGIGLLLWMCWLWMSLFEVMRDSLTMPIKGSTVTWGALLIFFCFLFWLQFLMFKMKTVIKVSNCIGVSIMLPVILAYCKIFKLNKNHSGEILARLTKEI